ncbi:probable disease resistance protein At4g27220 [Beta vulgaris subsp. vulgaris]|uniref:probable disease resistance protein At4g27220 n=1 Tax=Beta vulgaris subsp. vulgaris TaxID=3555 RepID=UPI002036A8E1|nr:probable disease resistance protein At4g27220 [Beta vulgaris subsp. vulgaris]XP_048504062.1 probable disease resistance protein At4g27220 [Beta vulgaris subsp. vulgaris]
MPSVIALVDSILVSISSFHNVLYDVRRMKRTAILDEQSAMESVSLQPEKKRRKVQPSLSINLEYVNRIIGWLGNNEISTIGIHGMGGIGKTTLAIELYTRLSNHDIPSSDDNYASAWVSVGIDFTVFQLQQKIASAFGIDFQDDKDVIRRASILNAFLSGLGKYILFLDDLWGDFRPEDVGIPRQCKLILISRLLDVFRILRCQKILKIETRSEEETWQVFQHCIGHGVSNLKEVPSCKKLVYHKCAGLPLAIITLANNMRGVVDASRWREFLEIMDPIQNIDVFSRLKLSYERLNNIKLQRCFLYSALYLKDKSLVSREELIRLWIGKRLINDVPSLQAQFDMGHSILNKLLNSCLLETCQDNKNIKMHDLVRRLAISILRDSNMVKTCIPSKWEL